jgi:transposase
MHARANHVRHTKRIIERVNLRTLFQSRAPDSVNERWMDSPPIAARVLSQIRHHIEPINLNGLRP